MGLQRKQLNKRNSLDETIHSGDTKINIPKYDEKIADTLVGDKNELNTLKMFQDLTGETGEYNFKDGRWNRLTPEKYNMLSKIKDAFGIKIYGTDAKKCEIIGEIDSSLIDNVIKNKQELSNMMSSSMYGRDLDTILFYSKLVEIGILKDFMEIFDKWERQRCSLENISFFEDVDFSKIKEIKQYIKSKNPDIIFDYHVIDRLKSLESIEYFGNILLKGVEKGGENYVILNANKLGTDHIRAEKQGENEYIINAYMPGHPGIAGRAFALMLQCLPKGAKIVEKESLSVNSFNIIINLYSKPESRKKWNIKRIIFQNKIQLNNEGEVGELATLVKEKNIGKDERLFETESRENAELIASEINKLIGKYIGNENIFATVREIEKEGCDNTWGVELPGFCIEMN